MTLYYIHFKILVVITSKPVHQDGDGKLPVTAEVLAFLGFYFYINGISKLAFNFFFQNEKNEIKTEKTKRKCRC